MPPNDLLYKILPRSAWAAATDRVPPSPVDLDDGFVHLSAGAQVRETARRHFAGRADLVILTIDASRWAPDTLRWEPSRGGALFPHVYGDVPRARVVRVDPLIEADGDFQLPPHVEPPSR